jgi:hypothetical protein
MPWAAVACNAAAVALNAATLFCFSCFPSVPQLQHDLHLLLFLLRCWLPCRCAPWPVRRPGLQHRPGGLAGLAAASQTWTGALQLHAGCLQHVPASNICLSKPAVLLGAEACCSCTGCSCSCMLRCMQGTEQSSSSGVVQLFMSSCAGTRLT